MAIGKRIVETLKRLGWERADLMARLPNLTPQALSNLIRRDSKRSEWDEAIASALGVSVTWLVYGSEASYDKADARRLSAQAPAPLPWSILQAIDLLTHTNATGQLIALGRLEEIADRYPAENSTHCKAKDTPCQHTTGQ